MELVGVNSCVGSIINENLDRNINNNTVESTNFNNDNGVNYYEAFEEPETSIAEIKDMLLNVQERVSRMEATLQKVVGFMATINKFMELRQTPKDQLKPEQKRASESFAELENLLPIKTVEGLEDFNTKLKVQSFSDKVFRYLETVFHLNGKRDGKAFFRNLLRKILEPNVLLPFSWLGNTRAIKGSNPPLKNRSFKQDFPDFVHLVATEATEESFCQFLRQ